MDDERDDLVAGLFRSQQQADTALQRMHRIGVADADIEVGAPEPGRYRIEYHQASDFWTAVRKGMLVGAVIGAIIAIGIMSFAMRGLSLPNLIELGLPAGAFWGVFVGGLSAVAARGGARASGEPLYVVTPDDPEVLVVVQAHDRFGLVHEALQREHPRYFLTDVPALHHATPHLAA